MWRQSIIRTTAVMSLAVAALGVYNQRVSVSEAGGLSSSIMSSGTFSSQPASVAVAKPSPTPAPRFAGRFGARDVVSGKVISLSATSIVVQGFAGKVTLPLSPLANFYQVVRDSAKALLTGQMVTVVVAGTSTSAASVAIAPPGNLYGTVQSFSFTGGARPTGTPGRTPPARGTPPVRGTPPAGFTGGRFTRSILAGTVTALTASKLTLKTVQGKTQSATLTSATAVYGFAQVAASAIKTGSTVSVTTSTSNGKQTAIAVTTSSLPNTTGWLTANP